MARPRKNPEFITKTCEGCKKEFTISSRKYKQRYCTKSCAQHDPRVLEKMKLSQNKTFNEKYGGHPMKTNKETVKRFKESIFKNYGEDYFSNYLVKKSKQTNLEKYGDENYNNIEQIKKTNLEKYGVKCYIHTNEYKEKSKKTCLEKYGTEFPSQSNLYKEKYKNTIWKRFLETGRFDNFSPLFDIKSYSGVLNKQKYLFKCDRCNQTVICFLHAGKYPICFNCDKDNSSFYQKEVYDFLRQELGNDIIILTNERNILYPKEIDIYLPSLKLAIEFNGLFWHSEISGNKNKVYHLNKLKKCMQKEIKLIHIFENEWVNNKEIIKSIFRNKIKTLKNKVHARNCIVKEISYEEASKFLELNHIQGKDKSNFKCGLFYNNELVSIMTFCKSRFDKKYEYELSRFCSKINTIIIGGASKLFSHFIKNKNPNSIITYSDRRYFEGDIYLKLGFSFIKNSPPSYHYIDRHEYKKILNRMPFQKKKLENLLENFDPNLTEWENMKNNGFDRIWDCGHSKWVFQPSDTKKIIKEI